jgi:hypothetical protein
MHEVKAGTGKESPPIVAVDEACSRGLQGVFDPVLATNGGFLNLKKSIQLEDSRSGLASRKTCG